MAVVTTYINSYGDITIFCFCLYTILICLYPLLRAALAVGNIVWLYVAALAALLGNYLMLALNTLFLGEWLYVGFDSFTLFNNIIDLSLAFGLTPLSYSFSLLVVVIGLATNIYILNYFKNEADEGGFIFWINSFVVSMLILVLSNNFFTLFLGWELIGFTSFFLINFWQSRRGTLKSSFKAFSFNLVSDLFLLGALVIFYQLTSTTDISTFLYLISWGGLYQESLINFAIFLLIGCASIKSVQLVGHLWLPDSMEAPVPASALIHSATLVSAGIYLLARFNLVLVLYNWMPCLTLLGAVTAAYGGVVAASQTDMKKLLAYSTMSHCGFLMILVSFSNFSVLIIYLFLHGLYKASTFFCAGSFIRVFGSQDTRVMGGGQRLFLGDTILLLLCAGNLCGLPLTMGVLYKTFFLKLMLFQPVGLLSAGFMILGMLMGAVYFYRLVYYSAFDIAKWTNLGLYTGLEANSTTFSEEGNFLNKNHLIGVSIILSFGLYVYVIFNWITGWGHLEYDMGLYNGFVPGYLFGLVNDFYSAYLIYFYAVYLIIFLAIFLLSWRSQYYWNNKGQAIIFSTFATLAGSVCALYI